MDKVYLLLGTNEGRREQNLSAAIALIAQNCGNVLQSSSLYETEAWGLKEQQAFLNEAVAIETSLPPLELLLVLKKLEKEIGRKETIKWGPRVIDMDILFYGNEIVNEEELKIPHPFIAERKFTLVCLNEIAGDLVHPVLKKTIKDLLKDCKDESFVRPYKFRENR